MAGLYPVLVQLPAHSRASATLTYQSELTLSPGTLVLVPLGARQTLGLVWDGPLAANSDGTSLPVAAPEKIKEISYAAQGLPALGLAWRRLLEFAASYYQRSTGEMVIGALPSALRQLTAAQLERALAPKKPKKQKAPAAALVDASASAQAWIPGQAGNDGLVLAGENLNGIDSASAERNAMDAIDLSAEQSSALAQIAAQSGPFLLHGSTGSGKTEVYLRCVQQLLETDEQAQALIMVPEINLTPQMEERVRARFEARYGAGAVVSLHSGLTPVQRLKSWLAAHRGPQLGGARIVLGTRMAVLASMPSLRLIVVDEEHDPSYKQQDGARHSARDLAVYRGQLQNAKVLLASATPSLESWRQSRPAAEGGRYQRISMPSRIDDAALPRVLLVDMRRQAAKTVLSTPLLDALRERVARSEQSLLLTQSMQARVSELEANFANAPFERILNTGRFDFERAQQHPLWFKELYGFADHTPETEQYGVRSFVYRARRPFEPVKFQQFLKESWAGVIRAKGHFWIATRPQWLGELSQAGAIVRTEGLGFWWANVPADRWPDDPLWRQSLEKNWNEIYGDRRQEIVFIGTAMDEDAIKARLDACLVSGKPGMHIKEWASLTDPFPAWRRANEAA